jgi:hypothetical protein
VADPVLRLMTANGGPIEAIQREPLGPTRRVLWQGDVPGSDVAHLRTHSRAGHATINLAHIGTSLVPSLPSSVAAPDEASGSHALLMVRPDLVCMLADTCIVLETNSAR